MNNQTVNWESSKQLKNNPEHKFDWMILWRASSLHVKRKILEGYLMKQLNSSLSNQLDSEILILFLTSFLFFNTNC